MAGRADYEERKQEKIDRYNMASDNSMAEYEAKHKAADSIAGRFEFGQPILVGHHSEAKARRDQERIGNLMDKAISAADKSQYYAKKAEVTENNATISPDDPNAVDKLQEKLDSLLAKQARIKKVNAYYRKNSTCKGCEGLSDEVASELDESMKTAYSWESAPYPSYELTSVNTKIKAAKERIVKIEKLDSISAHEPFIFDGGKVIENVEVNRVQIFFDERQSLETISILKRNGFKWARSEGAWQRLRTENLFEFAVRLIKKSTPATTEAGKL